MMSERKKGTRPNIYGCQMSGNQVPKLMQTPFCVAPFFPTWAVQYSQFGPRPQVRGQALRGRRTPVFLPLHAYPGHQS